MMSRLLKTFWTVAAMLGILIPISAGAETAPDVLARNTTEEVLSIIRKDKEIQAGNTRRIYELVDAKVLPHFDFNRMAQLAVGKHWSKATPEQKQSLVREFRMLLVRTYSNSLSAFGKYTVDFKPLAARPEDTDVTVKSEVRLPGAQPVPIDYTMEKMADGWKVYDVAVDGVSLVTNYRASFANEIRAKGIDGLIDTLAGKNATAMNGEAKTKAAEKGSAPQKNK